jgi:hypothetical protein
LQHIGMIARFVCFFIQWNLALLAACG